MSDTEYWLDYANKFSSIYQSYLRYKNLIKQLTIALCLLSVGQSEYKTLAVLSILTISKKKTKFGIKKNVELHQKQTCFLYFGPAKRMKNQFRRTWNWS